MPARDPTAEFHWTEQHDLLVLQRRPRPRRQRASKQAVHRGEHVCARLDPARHLGRTARRGLTPARVNAKYRHVHPQRHRQRSAAASGLAYFEVSSRSISGPIQQVGPYAIPAGAADSKGNDHCDDDLPGHHRWPAAQYWFYSIGFDGAGNVEVAPASPNVTFSNRDFAPGAASSHRLHG